MPGRMRRWMADHPVIDTLDLDGLPLSPPAPKRRTAEDRRREEEEAEEAEEAAEERRLRRETRRMEATVRQRQLLRTLERMDSPQADQSGMAAVVQRLVEEQNRRTDLILDELKELRQGAREVESTRLSQTVEHLAERVEEIAKGGGQNGAGISPIGQLVSAFREANEAQEQIRSMFPQPTVPEGVSRAEGLRRVVVDHEVRLRERQLRHEEEELEWERQNAREQRQHEIARMEGALSAAKEVVPQLAEALFGEKLIGRLKMGGGSQAQQPEVRAAPPPGMRAWRCPVEDCGTINYAPIESLEATCAGCGTDCEIEPPEGAEPTPAPVPGPLVRPGMSAPGPVQRPGLALVAGGGPPPEPPEGDSGEDYEGDEHWTGI
jgi:hypothetical protein